VLADDGLSDATWCMQEIPQPLGRYLAPTLLMFTFPFDVGRHYVVLETTVTFELN